MVKRKMRKEGDSNAGDPTAPDSETQNLGDTFDMPLSDTSLQHAMTGESDSEID